jgi:hypothetical protein
VNLTRLRELPDTECVFTFVLAPNNIVTQFDTVEANAAVYTENQFFDLFPALTTEHTPTIVSVVTDAGHRFS